MKFVSTIKKPILASLVLLLLCGFAYPLALTGISHLLFPYQANGSLIEVDGLAVGSEHVGQKFTDPRFMRGRPSAYHYNTYTAAAVASGEYAGVGSGSHNYSASNPALITRVQEDIDAFLAEHPSLTIEDLPADLMTASGSGLDPHISPASAALQIPQLALNTGLTEAALQEIVAANSKEKFLGVFGEAHVNVLGVNLAIASALGLL